MEPPPSRRLEFSTVLRTILDSSNVYFQPPPDKQMVYPCMVYELQDVPIRHADNGAYTMHDQYQVTLISKEPNHPAIRQLLALPHSSFSRHFATSGLNHDVFVIHH